MLKAQKQIENIQKSILQQMKSEDKNISLSLPSGCGKSSIFESFTKNTQQVCYFLSVRKEIFPKFKEKSESIHVCTFSDILDKLNKDTYLHVDTLVLCDELSSLGSYCLSQYAELVNILERTNPDLKKIFINSKHIIATEAVEDNTPQEIFSCS